jgi:hypothetical protein
MIFGSVRVAGKSVETHRDSYLLSHLTVISVRRPLLAGGCLFASGGAAFALSFGDLLYPGEIAALAGFSLSAVLTGFIVGQIQLLSRDLRGSELSCMIWGSYGHLNRIRREIGNALQDGARKEGA